MVIEKIVRILTFLKVCIGAHELNLKYLVTIKNEKVFSDCSLFQVHI